ncbi:MBL fold metallo-hydrolase [Catenulispora pinisilvae]|uniref:MBL fold metallo-hydrolase n=3 Tax=Catenulispora pinisilvae TaxID=2705253 RepID=UPI001892578D|nr:MBL fold metallo-hydrolase [Catenulispora pinisilvae]
MAKHFRIGDVVRVDGDVHAVLGSDVTWVVVKDGDDATLIDTGYPRDHDALLASLELLKVAPQSVNAILITHAHNDHIGSAERLRAEYGIPVLMHPDEVPHARRDFLDQVSAGAVAANAWRPGVAAWGLRAVRNGGTAHVPVTEPQAFPAPGPLDLPGAPIPLHTPGHTAGHCAYLLPATGIVVAGDAMSTGHPTSRVSGPQVLPAMFQKDLPGALASLDVIAEADADILIPGHGPVHRGSPRAAVEQARQRGAAF